MNPQNYSGQGGNRSDAGKKGAPSRGSEDRSESIKKAAQHKGQESQNDIGRKSGQQSGGGRRREDEE